MSKLYHKKGRGALPRPFEPREFNLMIEVSK